MTPRLPVKAVTGLVLRLSIERAQTWLAHGENHSEGWHGAGAPRQPGPTGFSWEGGRTDGGDRRDRTPMSNPLITRMEMFTAELTGIVRRTESG